MELAWQCGLHGPGDGRDVLRRAGCWSNGRMQGFREQGDMGPFLRHTVTGSLPSPCGWNWTPTPASTYRFLTAALDPWTQR